MLRGQRAACFQHLAIRLDCQHAMPRFEKDLRQHSRAGADIGNDCISRQRAMLTQKRHDLTRESWPIGQVRLHAARKSLRV